MGRPTALLNKFSNKSERIKNHLKKCQHFISKVGSIEDVSRILDVELEEVKDVKAKKRCIEPNLSTEKGPLEKYFIRPLSNQDKKKFETLLLRATVLLD